MFILKSKIPEFTLEGIDGIKTVFGYTQEQFAKTLFASSHIRMVHVLDYNPPSCCNEVLMDTHLGSDHLLGMVRRLEKLVYSYSKEDLRESIVTSSEGLLFKSLASAPAAIIYFCSVDTTSFSDEEILHSYIMFFLEQVDILINQFYNLRMEVPDFPFRLFTYPKLINKLYSVAEVDIDVQYFGKKLPSLEGDKPFWINPRFDYIHAFLDYCYPKDRKPSYYHKLSLHQKILYYFQFCRFKLEKVLGVHSRRWI